MVKENIERVTCNCDSTLWMKGKMERKYGWREYLEAGIQVLTGEYNKKEQDVLQEINKKKSEVNFLEKRLEEIRKENKKKKEEQQRNVVEHW